MPVAANVYQLRRALPIAVWLVLTSLGGCTGEILDPPRGFGSGDRSGNGLGPGSNDPANLAPPTAGPSVTVGEVDIEPGRVVAHRLNRLEYNNTIRDLFFGLELRPADAFPVDNYAEGFDNNAEELSMSNLLLEKYLAAADQVVTAALAAPQVRERLLPCSLEQEGRDCAHSALQTFAERAFRRPLEEDELSPYLDLLEIAAEEGDGEEAGLTLALRAILISPSFLYRIEPDPPAGTSRTLNDFEVASRLSYFLWSSMPDESLFAHSRAGALRTAEQIRAQVARMLDDEKASALVDNLAGQWLFARQLPELHPDPEVFGDGAWDEPLRAAMQAEMHAFLREILLGDRPVTDLLGTDFTYANQRLGEHYDWQNAEDMGEALTRVTPGDDRRGGLLTQAGWLTVTSHPDRTSPIKRGKWILSQLLCQEPPPAPPGVESLEKVPTTGSLRQRLAQHSAVEPCKTCHALIDPLGFALEHYDAIGRWRDDDAGFAIDATGVIPGTDVAFDGAAELVQALQEDPRFFRCLTQKLLTFAAGRGMKPSDAPALDHFTDAFKKQGQRFRDLIEIVAASPLMTMRGGKGEP